MTSHPNRRYGAPMRSASYLKIARELREIADRIEANAYRKTPEQKRCMSLAIGRLSSRVRNWHHRHNNTVSHEQK